MHVSHGVFADSNVRHDSFLSEVVVLVDGTDMDDDLVVLVFVTSINVVDMLVVSTCFSGVMGVDTGDVHPSSESDGRVLILKHHRVSDLERVTVFGVHNVLNTFGVHPVLVRDHF